MATVPRLLSYEDWLAMPPAEAGREEVVNGELQIVPPNRYTHAEIIRRLTDAILSRIDRDQVRLYGSNLTLLITPEPLTCRAPDMVIYWQDRIVLDENEVFCSPPDLVIEVLSPSETKRRKQGKLDDYARIGVPEAWIISPEAETVEIRLLVDGKLSLSRIIVEGNLQPTRFPGVTIPVAEIWPE